MKKRIWISMACVLALCLLLAGCSKAPSQPDAAAEAFLRECFTMNKDSRYDTMLTDTDEAAGQLVETNGKGVQPLLDEITNNYYQNLSKFTTETCLNTLMSNRLPAKFDRMVSEAGLTAQIDTLQLTPSGDAAYTFEITYDSDAVNTLLNAPITGQVTLQEENGSVLVNSLRIDSK